MSKPDLIAIIEAQEALAHGRGQLQEDRIAAMDAYLGRPYGDEEEGRSSIVMRDVADTVEWIKPSLMKVFCSGDEVCVFNPVGPEDEQQAEQETDYCNDVLMRRNEGFLVILDWVHDALVQKNGYVLVSFEEEDDTQRDTYEGISDDDFALMADSGEVEIVEHTERQQMLPGQPDPMTGQPGKPAQVLVHDVTVSSTKTTGRIKVTNIPPERVLVAPNWPGVSLQGCPFVEVIDFKTLSELRADGLDVPDDINDEGGEDESAAELARRVTHDGVDSHQDVGADAATRLLRVRYVWMTIDEDGDGKAEQRRFVVVGKTILENDEDSLIPVACATPYRVPHEHNGLSVHDYVEDIQRIRTALTRGFLDNMYLTNNPRYGVDASKVNVDDMLTSRPGGVVRVNGAPGEALSPLVHPADGGAILQAMEYVDTVRENRTGVTKYNQGLDANSLNKTMGGITQIMSASQQRIELIARVIAETGMRQLMLIIHAMSKKHSRQAEMLKLRNTWVSVDPTSWKTRRDLTVSVGIGTGNKDQMLQHLQMILMAQKEAAPIGLATPKNMFNALTKLTQNAGFKMPEQFWTDPAKAAPQQPAPNPDAIKAQASTQLAQIKAQSDAAAAQARAQVDVMLKQAELNAQAEELARQLAADGDQKALDREADLEKVRIQSATQIELARMGHESAMVGKAVDQQNAASQAAQQVDTANQAKAGDAARVDQIVADLRQMVDGLSQTMLRPLKVVRGEDGRAAELH